MADNVVTPYGTVASDDIGGVKFQQVKLDVGGDGVSVPVVGALPVIADNLPLPAGAATESTLAAIKSKTDNLPSDPALNGAALTGQSLEAGGSGILGWLSSIRKMAEALKTTIVLAAGSAVIGATQDAGPGTGAGVMQAPAHGDMSAGTTQLAAAAGTGLKWVVTDIIISTAAAAEISIYDDEATNVLFGPILMPANGYAQFTPRGKLKQGTANKKLYGKSSTADHCTIQVSVVAEA